MRHGWCAFTLLATVWGQASDEVFELKPVVDGVYAAIAKPSYKVNCNAAVILLDDGVLVVDTHSTISAAKALIRQIKSITDKPVRYVVDTHFHWDHYRGNTAYPNAWPNGLEIISSELTHENIRHQGIPRLKREIVEFPKEIAKLKSELTKTTAVEQKEKIQKDIREAESYLAELKTMRATLPTMTFERSLTLHQGSRTVHILWLGRAHTSGDVLVYLPDDKVVVTGDLLQGWIPYLGDGYPYDWIETLEEAMKLEFEYVIGGHGDVMRGKGQFELWRDYLIDLMAETGDAYSKGLSLSGAIDAVAPKMKTRWAERFPLQKFLDNVEGNVRDAYQKLAFVQ